MTIQNRSLWKMTALLIGSASTSQTLGQVAYFDSSTDTVRLPGQTLLGTTATYEARIALTRSPQSNGRIWNEHLAGGEDKALSITPSGIYGYAWPVGRPNPLQSSLPLSVGEWHHIAYVKDVSEERLYVDGVLTTSRVTAGGIANSSNANAVASVGCIRRTEGFVDPGFVGLIDTLRISAIARYSSNFTPISGDFSADGSTLILLNFNEVAGSTVLTDLSGHNENGQLSSWFAGATLPELQPGPVFYLQPMGKLICPGGTVSLTAAAIAFDPVAYEWRKNGEPIDAVVNPSSRTSTLILPLAQATDEASYTCVASAGRRETVSSASFVNVCVTDYNCDSFVDFFDYTDYVQCFVGDNCPPGSSADFNADGFVDFFDYSDFVDAFEAGC